MYRQTRPKHCCHQAVAAVINGTEFCGYKCQLCTEQIMEVVKLTGISHLNVIDVHYLIS